MSAPSNSDARERRVAELSTGQRQILARLLGSQGAAAPRLARRTGADSLEVSFAQRRMWILDRLMPGGEVYNETTLIRFPREIDPEIIEASLNEIIRRHEALRTTFREVDNRLVQVIAPELDISVPIIDLRSVPGAQLTAEVERIAREKGRQPFDLGRGPLIRAVLLRARKEWALAVTLHHIVCDGWSMCVLVRELAVLEKAFALGIASPLPELGLQYADFAQWQRQYLQGKRLDRELSYWREQLGDMPVLNLPSDRPRPVMPTFEGDREPVWLDQSLLNRLRVLGNGEGTTLFMTLLGAFQMLLHRYSGRDDIAVGTPIANRSLKETEGLIGFFANTIVLRTSFSGEPTFRQVLAQVRKTALAAYDHQDIPFERLVEELAPKRDLTRNPLFQVAFQLFSAPTWSGPQLGGVGEPRQINLGISKVDLRLDLTDLGTHIQGYIEYNSALWNASSIARMARRYTVLLEAAAADPDCEVSRLPLLTEEEVLPLLGWSTGGPGAASRCLHHLFEERAVSSAGSPAVIDGSSEASFAEVNRRANQLAHYLRALGVQRGAIVGVCTGRSADIVTSFLGILKVGGAYLPLDPQLPRERLHHLMRDAAPAAIISEGRWREQLAGYPGRLIWLEEEAPAIARQPPDDLRIALGPHDLAYVIYTSGSTGMPKGVLVEHGGAANVAAEQVRRLGIGQGDRILQFASVSYDASIFEMLMTFCGGATLVMALPDQLMPGPPLLRTLRNRQISTVTLPPSCLAAVPQEDIPALRLLNLAGEPAPPTLVADWAQGRKLFNLYGPTECTIWSTFAELDGSGSTFIGRAISGATTYVLDRDLQLVPIGLPGQLYIGGGGLARGYLNQAALTASKFIPDPFSRNPGSRLYATGDYARYGCDGQLEFLGRVDCQVKLRGFRIELGEIESALAGHPDVLESVVVPHDDETGDKRLVAYVVPRADGIAPQDDVPGADWDAAQVQRWQSTYDRTYDQVAQQADPLCNFTGWNSSYTGQPIPADEMREQADATAERILAMQPRRILEIGCGTGSLLFRLAPHCQRYCGTDISVAGIAHLEKQVRDSLPNVELRHAAADDFSWVETGAFDLVVLNSVIQYFPSAAYLVRVLKQAMRAVCPGGYVFVGDARNLELAEVFCSSVEAVRAGPGATRREVCARAARRLRQDQELLVSPAFFESLGNDEGDAIVAEVQLKRGWASNELTCFRYDVTLQVTPEAMPVPVESETSWDALGSIANLVSYLQKEHPGEMVVRGVPNARLQDALRTDARLRDECQSRSDGNDSCGIEPEAIWALQDATDYEIRIGWSAGGDLGTFDALLYRRKSGSSAPRLVWQRAANPHRKSASFTNEPQRNSERLQLVPRLREYLRQRLPDYMVPAFFMVLPSLPLTSSGKMDRRQLPAPGAIQDGPDRGFVAPGTKLQQQIASLWQNVLGVDAVGLHDNFFDLGGHSLLMVRLHGLVCAELGVDVSVTDLFRFSTVSALASFIDEGGSPQPLPAVGDRAGKQRRSMNLRAAGERNQASVPMDPETAERTEKADYVTVHNGLHPAQVSRLQELVKWRSFRSG
jgi:amino acid adenylation domain-containing protein